ncbi:ABC transporter permease subunit [Reinekea sp. G2M2-21]|uniref:ABC transporter permease subunit n=1 Tax=Reinekea sp. G2M2-21 TaxID=2788942 RepID=UPI0018A94276
MVWLSKLTTFTILLTLALAGVGLYLHPGYGYPWSDYFDAWFLKIVQFSIWQAFLSALFSVILAIPFAVVYASKPFTGQWLLKGLLNLFFIMPVLTVILGVVTAYSDFIDVFSLQGILLAHLYLNVPYAVRIFWQRLSFVSQTHLNVAQTLHLSTWRSFWWIKRPVLVSALRPVFVLVFLLCFSSFTVVLSLGGGPANTNLEVAIFQALKFDFDPKAGAIYAAVHGILAMSIMLLLGRREHFGMEINRAQAQRATVPTKMQFLAIATLVVVLVYPLLTLLAHAFSAPFTGSERLWRGIITSLLLALGSGLFATLLATLRSLDTSQHRLLRFLDFGLMVLPVMVISTGLFLFALKLNIAFKATIPLIIWLNGLMAMPIVLGPLTSRVQAYRESYSRLADTLAMSDWSKVRYVYLPAAAHLLPWSLMLAMVLSVGDLGVAALIGSAQFVTLPILIYQAMGSYQMVLASQLTLLLLLMCVIFLLIAEWFGDRTLRRH